jgi:hypothetical protein
MTMTRRRSMLLAVTLVAVSSFFGLAPAGFAIPAAMVNDLFGSRLVRAEVLVSTPGGTTDYRIDRGTIVSSDAGSITLRELNGEVVTIPVAPDARVQGGGRLGTVGQLRKRTRVTVLRDANGPVSMVQVEGGPGGVIGDLVGSRLVRAEVLVQTPGGTTDYRIDRGTIVSSDAGSITLRELNGEIVTIPVAPDARVQGGGRFGTVAQLRKRTRATVLRDANGPVSVVQVEGGPGGGGSSSTGNGK